MNQLTLNLLTPFEVATIEQLSSYRVGKRKGETDLECEKRLLELMSSQDFIDECIGKCKQWNKQRIDKGLKPWE